MTYVMSDIHGSLRRFRSVMEQIALTGADELYVLGDVVDRGTGGLRILRELMAMPNAHVLLGNHEYMMLAALGEPYDGSTADWSQEDLLKLWYQNGGNVTHRAWKLTRKSERREMLDFLKALPVNLDVTVKEVRYRLAHAAPVELYPFYQRLGGRESEVFFAVWDRDITFQVPPPGDYILIFGHTPTVYFQENNPLSIWRTAGRMCIDCGSGFPDRPSPTFPLQGRLACLRLEDGEEFYSRESAGPNP